MGRRGIQPWLTSLVAERQLTLDGQRTVVGFSLAGGLATLPNLLAGVLDVNVRSLAPAQDPHEFTAAFGVDLTTLNLSTSIVLIDQVMSEADSDGFDLGYRA